MQVNMVFCKYSTTMFHTNNVQRHVTIQTGFQNEDVGLFGVQHDVVQFTVKSHRS